METELKKVSLQKVDNSVYLSYGEKWYIADDDPIALLRQESKTKTPWVLEKIGEHFELSPQLQVLDVGCGGGFLSNAMAKAGLSVTGVDIAEDSIRIAALYDSTKTARYITADAYNLPFEDSSFDVVTAMDFLEHVEDPQAVIQEFSRVLKPGGLFIFHTFNRNWLAYLIIIKLVEWVVKNTPKNLHILRLFIKPKELSLFCLRSGMFIQEMVGIKPVFSTIPLKNLFTGIVPKSLKFEIVNSLLLSYMGVAEKRR